MKVGLLSQGKMLHGESSNVACSVYILKILIHYYLNNLSNYLTNATMSQTKRTYKAMLHLNVGD